MLLAYEYSSCRLSQIEPWRSSSRLRLGCAVHISWGVPLYTWSLRREPAGRAIIARSSIRPDIVYQRSSVNDHTTPRRRIPALLPRKDHQYTETLHHERSLEDRLSCAPREHGFTGSGRKLFAST